MERANTATSPAPVATHSTTPGVVGTGVGCERITVPAASNRDASARHVDGVGKPSRVEVSSCPQMVARTTPTTPDATTTPTLTRNRLATVAARWPATTLAMMGPTTCAAPGG